MGDRICSVPGCGKDLLARGWCSTHYHRWRTTGEVGTAELLRKPSGTTPCSIDGCGRNAHANGMCHRHAANLRNYGHAIPIKEWTIRQRLDAVGWDVTPEGCWEWRGKLHQFGYGLISLKSRQYRVHRLIYEETYGPIPDGLIVRHKCDNPPCSNPAHLEMGTMADNSGDMVERRRHWAHDRTECPNGHDVTAPDALKVVTQRGRKPYNTCVQCDRDRKRRWMQQKHAS